MSITEGVGWPLLLSTLAGLSTSIGAVLAVCRVPDEATLAFLLGTAVGVMTTVSAAELWVRTALEQGDWLGISASVAAGVGVFAVLDPLLPKPPDPTLLVTNGAANGDQDRQVHMDAKQHQHKSAPAEPRQQSLSARQGSAYKQAAAGSSPSSAQAPLARHGSAGNTAAQELQALVSKPSTIGDSTTAPGSTAVANALPAFYTSSSGSNARQPINAAALQQQQSSLMRLGVLMAVTMTLHNLPEGFAVAFSAFTKVGVVMALAIAIHNIPEGLVIAAPIYAATNSKLCAVGIAAASGLSEPVGAIFALFLVKPFVTTIERLDYVLAFVGGIMLAVSGMELWPEGRKCRQDKKMIQGILLGIFVMAWTLYVGA